ncbi:HTH-type transcriptional regulator VirS [Shewanella sp. P1-14-1]|uniref:helix-turn-helix domain-containing protein n=1 Tax=Shewanella sp. P1-14-1 TaxID=1723761 RepID=UPI0006D685BC|nr:AraC family transcriptional regulator [Shewanella sp. P1-14-1]KPZ67651.1 HTH-type transcriptional regulator VirS [Shewanella sp. P1-14-1]
MTETQSNAKNKTQHAVQAESKKTLEENHYIPLLRAEYFVPFIARLKDFENNIYPVLKEAGLPDTVLSSEPEYLSEAALQKLLAIMYRKLNSKRFANWLEQVARSIFVPQHLAKMALNGTVRDALLEFTHLVNSESKQTNIQLKTSVNKVWFARYRNIKHSFDANLAELFAVTMMLELIRVLTQSQWSPDEIALQSPSEVDYLSELKVSKSQIYYARSVTAVSISAEVLSQSVKYKKGWSQPPQAVIEGPERFIDSFTHALTPYLSMGRISITTAADLLGLSVRTLQRRLTEEGLSYSKVIEGICFEQAKLMLNDPSVPVTQISSALGYADVAHFSRAFKRLAGVSPREFRKNLS